MKKNQKNPSTAYKGRIDIGATVACVRKDGTVVVGTVVTSPKWKQIHEDGPSTPCLAVLERWSEDDSPLFMFKSVERVSP